jgi:nitric oxide reductase subunit B
MRLPGDLVFIVFGAVPLLVACTRAYLGMRARVASHPDAAGP